MAFRIGTKNSTLRNRAFEIIKKLYAAMDITRDFSASEFRNMSHGAATTVRGKTKLLLQTFATQDSAITLKNPLDPLADYTTAYTNLGKVLAVNPPPVVEEEEPSFNWAAELKERAASQPLKSGPGPFAGGKGLGTPTQDTTDPELAPILGEEGDDFAEEGNAWTRLPTAAQVGIVTGGSVAGILLLRSLVRGRG